MSVSTTLEVSPYTELSRANRYIRKDEIRGKMNCKSATVSSVFTAGGGLMRQVCWRPPLSYITAAEGDIHADARGQFSRFIHAKITFKNLLDTPIKVFVNTPLGTIENDTDIVTRIKHMEVNLAPSGTKVMKSSGSGKKKKSFSASTDVYTHFFSSADVDTQDTNYKTILKSKISVTTAPAYKYYGWVMAEYCVVLNDVNKNTGVSYAEALDALEVEYRVKYEVSALGQGTSAADQVKTSAFSISTGEAKLMFDYDSTPLVSAALETKKKVPSVVDFIRLKTEGKSVGLRFDPNPDGTFQGILSLFNEDGLMVGNATSDFDDGRYRFVVPGLSLTSWSYDKYPSTHVQGFEFGFIDGRMCAVDHKGKPVGFNGNNPQEVIYLNGQTPVMVYDSIRSRNLIEERQLKLTFSEFINAISIVLKVATFAYSLL